MQGEGHSGATTSASIERRLATIMMADVFGYSRMMGENEERTVHTLRGHRTVFDELLRVHRGRVFNTAGDAILAEFPSAVEAVRCATEIQAALRTRNEHLPDAQRMWFRIGINLGDVIVQGGDLLGDGVNVAARIQSITEPGGVCISGSVYDQIQNKLALQIRPLGEKSFKNIVQSVRTFSISGDGAAPLPLGLRWRALRKGPIAATLAAAVIFAGVVGAGYWLYRDYSVRAAEETRRAEEAKRAAELQRQAELDKATAASTQKEATLLAELQSAKDALAQAELNRRKAEQDRVAAEVAQREARLQGELKSTKDALQRAAESEKKAEQEREAANDAVKAAQAAAKKEAELERGAASAASTQAGTQNAQAPARLASAASAPLPGGRTTAATAAGVKRYDGAYIGRMCRPNPDGTPRCWPVSLTVQRGALSASWTTYYDQPVTARGTLAPDGTVKIVLDSVTQKGRPLRGSLDGSLVDNTVTVSGRWSNGTPLTGTWSLNP